MARIITQSFGGTEWRMINVGASVGRGGSNRRDDVMVVQALMKYGLERLPNLSPAIYPPPNGVVDSNLIQYIENYQRYLRRKQNTRVSVDGRIDPAKGLNAGRRGTLSWTIAALNNDAQTRYMFFNNDLIHGDRYIQDLCKQYPQVNAILSGKAVGTLSLALA